MASREKAFHLNRMPTLFERDQIVEFYQKCLGKGTDRKRASQILTRHQNASRNNKGYRSPIVQNPDGSWRGTWTEKPTAMLNLPTDGGAENLHNVLQEAMKGRSFSTEELKALIAEKFPDRNLKTQYDRAIDKANHIARWSKATKRWYWWNEVPADLSNFPPDLNDGSKYSERLRLFGDMPRRKHKPEEEFSAETSEVFKWMIERSGLSLAEVTAEWKRLPYSWIDSVKKEKDSEDNLAKANRIFDRGTGEWLGPLTYRAELAAPNREQSDDNPSRVDPEEEKDPELEEEKGYLYRKDDEWLVGTRGKLIRLDTLSDIEAMERMTPNKAAKWIKERLDFSVDMGRFIESLIDHDILCRDYDGNLEGTTARMDRKAVEMRQRYDWPERLNGDFELKLVFKNLYAGSKLEVLKRAEEFVKMYWSDLNHEEFSREDNKGAKKLARLAVDSGVVVETDDYGRKIWRCAA